MSGIDDDVRQTVRDVVRVWLDGTTGGRYTNEVTAAVLSVPAVRDALARDAQVRGIVDAYRSGPVSLVIKRMEQVAALYSEVASMLRDGEG